jgi:hypothetical protein
VEAAGIEPASGDAEPPRLYRLSRCFVTTFGTSTGKLPEGVPSPIVVSVPDGQGTETQHPALTPLGRRVRPT